ncbi:MAG: AAA family ATPase [Bacillota bacterium]|nr:AAA family ATPase [Bacillota bacterium]
MILRRLTVRFWRGLLSPIELEPADGLTVVVGPNETGKSTLMEAIHHALFERPDTTSRDILAITPKGRRLLPQVSLEFEARGSTYRVEKTFFARREHTLLSREEKGDWRPLAQDREAGEMIARILEEDGVAQYAGTLWSSQGSSPGVLTEGVPQPLRSRLSDTLAGMLVTEDDQRLINDVSREWRGRFTPGGRMLTGSAWQRATAEATATERKLAEERQTEAQHEDTVRQCESAGQAARATLLEYEAAKAAGAALRERRKAWDGYATMDAKARAGEQAAEGLAKIKRQWTEYIEDISTIQTRLDASWLKAAGGRTEHEHAAAARSLKARSVQDLDQQAQRLSVLRRYIWLLKASRELRRLRDLRSGEIAAPTSAQMKSLRSAWTAATNAKARLDAMAMKLKIVAEVSLCGAVSADQGPEARFAVQPGSSETWDAAHSFELGIDGTAKISVSTGMKDARGAKEQLDRLLEQLVHDMGMSSRTSAVQFENVDAAWRELEQQYEQAEALRKRIGDAETAARVRLGDMTEESTGLSLLELRSQHAEALSVAREEGWESLDESALGRKDVDLSETGRACLESLKEARAALERVEQVVRAKQEALRDAEAETQVLSARKAAGLKELHRVHRLASGSHQALAAITTRVWAEGERFEPAVEQAGEMFVLLGSLAEQELAAATQLRRDALAIKPEGEHVTNDQVKRLEARAAELESRHWDSQAKFNKLLGQVLNSADGLSERVHEHEEELFQKRREEESLGREAMAWDLLKAVLDEEHAKMVDAVIEPLQKKVEPWIARLTGGRHTSVELDPKGLQPRAISGDYESLRLDAKTKEVSFGTTEQVAFVARLALATLLAGDGGKRDTRDKQVVLLDDVLVNSDPGRQARAWELLLENTGALQIVFFTCHPVPDAVRQRAKVIELG